MTFQPLVLSARSNPAMSRYENTSGKHNKFWEVSSVGSRLTVRWGRIGTKGQTKSKSFLTTRDATYAGLKMIQDKLEGGYHHVRAGQGAAARPVEKKRASVRSPKPKPKPKSKPAKAKPSKSKPKQKSKPTESSKFSSTRSPEFQKALREVVRQIDALPRPKKHFLEGGDGVSGYGWIEIFGVRGSGKRGFRKIAGPDEWTAATEKRARQIVEKAFGSRAFFAVNVD